MINTSLKSPLNILYAFYQTPKSYGRCTVCKVVVEREHHARWELSALEKFLDAMEWKPYMDKLREIYYMFNKDKAEYQRIFYNKFPTIDDKSCLRKSPKTPFIKPDYGIHEKPFQLPRKLDDVPYKRMLAAESSYSVIQTDITRTEDKSKNISDKDFNIYTLRQVANEADIPPYYIDIWFDKCRIHNLP